MKKPCNIDSLLNNKSAKHISIKFIEDSTYEDVVYQFIKGLVDADFAPEKEVIGGILDIVSWEIKKTEGH